jgi:hypothetical protein
MSEHDVSASWPVAELDRVARLRVLAAGIPGATFREYRVRSDFEHAWSILADLERSVPVYDGQVTRLDVVDRTPAPDGVGERLQARVRVSKWTGPLTQRFDIDLSPGWCWMVADPQLYLVGMAAEPDGTGTRLGHLEGVPLPTGRALRPLVGPALRLLRPLHRHHVEGDIKGIIELIDG